MDQHIYELVYKVTHAGGSGSCFYLKEYGLFVTNYHVVKGFRQVALHDRNRNPFLADVVLVNPTHDIALLKAEGDFSQLPDLQLASDDSLQVGCKVFVAGYPFGMPFTLTEGSVSSPKQLMEGKYYVQTDAAVNPGNSGGPIFNDKNQVIGVTVSKFTQADNMGFGVRVETLRSLLSTIAELDRSGYYVQCGSCDGMVADDEGFCPSCGEKLPEEAFAELHLSSIAEFCEEAIGKMGINAIMARNGRDSWTFHKGSSEIRMFVYNGDYLFTTSPVVLLPKKDVEPVLRYILGTDFLPYKLGVDGKQIYIAYRIHLSDITDDTAAEVQANLVNLALRADELDNLLVEKYGCEFSEYSKVDAEA